MHKPVPPPDIAREVRDCLAAEFSVAVSSGHAVVTEILDHQLNATEDREKWRPLRQARESVRDLGHTLRARLDARTRERIDAKLSPEKDAFSKTARFSLETLSLVSEDEVQEEIAVGNAARRLSEATGDEFYALNMRLATALRREKFPDEQSPVHARVFARALLEVLAEATDDRGARLAAFAAFDPALLHALPKAYRAGNALLVQRGVLPDLRRSYGAPEQVSGIRGYSRGTSPAAADAMAPAAAAPPLALFDRLLASTAATPAPEPPPAGLVTLHVSPELAQALRKLEARLDTAPGALQALADAVVPAAATAPVVHSPDVVHQARQEVAGSLTPADVLVADLVAAMFARLFEDPGVSDAAKVQLGRLQLPVFKAVMADRRFFTDPAHPIRGLIDTIAELGGSAERHPVDGKLPEEWLTEETQALVEGRDLDVDAFAAARDRLAGVAQRHHEVLAESDALVRSARREDAAASALQDAALEAAHRIGATQCPQFAAAFAYRAWRPVLAHDHRTAGHGSAQWVADLQTLDDLLWTFSPRVTALERERLRSLLPSVRYRMWQGFIRAQLTTREIEGILGELDHIHAELERAPLAIAQGELTTTVALASAVQEDFTATLHVSSGAMRDEGLARGAWFEFTEDDGGVRRARLAWVSPVQGACVFKDLAHGNSFAISLADLRAKRDAGRARPVDGPGIANASIEGALQDVVRDRGVATSG